MRHALRYTHVAVSTLYLYRWKCSSGYTQVAVSTPVLCDWHQDWVATPEFDVMSFLSGSAFALLALFGMQRQDVLLGVYCSTLRGQELHVARLLL